MNLHPLHQVRLVSIHAALHAVLFLQLRVGHLVDIPPLLELLPRQQVDGSATVFHAAAKTIPAEPLLNEVDQ